METNNKASCSICGDVCSKNSYRSGIYIGKKILIITPFNPDGVGGAETFTKSLLDEVRKYFRITLLTRKQKTVAWDNTSFLVGGLWTLQLLFKAIGLQRRYRYDTIHCLGTIGLLTGVILKKLFKVKLIGTTLALYNFKLYPYWKYRILYWIYNQADIIFVEDDFGVVDLLELGIKINKIDKFMHWVDLEEFKPSSRGHDELVVLFIGRPIYKKGKHILLQAEREIKKLNLNVRFYYVENVPQSALPVFYKNSDICCIPSCYAEGVSRVVLEAASCGCAVLSSNYGSLETLISGFGITFEPTSENFKNNIIMLYNNRSILEILKLQSRKYAEEHFSSKNAEVFMKEY